MAVQISLQATPRLSEDKVKQCIDPRLKGEYPPKGVAKVSLSYPLYAVSHCFVVVILMNNGVTDVTPRTLSPAACRGGGSVRAIRSGVQAQHEHRRQGAHSSSAAKSSSTSSLRACGPGNRGLMRHTKGPLGAYCLTIAHWVQFGSGMEIHFAGF